MRESTKTAVAVLVVVALAGAFWLILLSPKQQKASELSERAEALSGEVVVEQQRAEAGLAAEKEFPRDYQQLVLLGKAVPAESATPSLLVQLGGIGAAASTSFQGISQAAGGESVAPESAEGAAALPLGATTGPAGLAAMPYTLEFSGGFFDIAKFIRGIDSLVETTDGKIDARGRLITVDGFNLEPAVDAEGEAATSAGTLKATFNVSTYVTPPGQGLTAGATPAGPGETTPNIP